MMRRKHETLLPTLAPFLLSNGVRAWMPMSEWPIGFPTGWINASRAGEFAGVRTTRPHAGSLGMRTTRPHSGNPAA